MNTQVNPEIGQSIRTGAIVTNYHDIGSGEPVLLLHGSGPGVSAWANWRLTIQGLKDDFRLLAPDLAGFGYTRVPEGIEYSREVWLEQMVAFLDALGVERVNVIGNSFGGSMALALAATGVMFPFFSAFLGMLGVFLTGSDTSSNTLFGPLQATTAKVSGLDPILTAATNSSGGVMGKMISPQNLSVGAAGVGAVGSEGLIFRRLIGHSLVLTGLVGLLAMRQAYVFTWMLPVW